MESDLRPFDQFLATMWTIGGSEAYSSVSLRIQSSRIPGDLMKQFLSGAGVDTTATVLAALKANATIFAADLYLIGEMMTRRRCG